MAFAQSIVQITFIPLLLPLMAELAQTDEIQVYDANIAEPAVFSI